MFESDYDAPCGIIYQAYEERWFIKDGFQVLQDVNEFDETRMHSDHSEISSEFVFFKYRSREVAEEVRWVSSLEDVSYGRR